VIRSYRGVAPRIAATALVTPVADVLGDVLLEAGAACWPGTILRGDVHGDDAKIDGNHFVHEGDEQDQPWAVALSAEVQDRLRHAAEPKDDGALIFAQNVKRVPQRNHDKPDDCQKQGIQKKREHVKITSFL
jgi:hypothetical protein